MNNIDATAQASYLQSFELAVQYVNGSIVERDLPRAAELFQHAAASGYDRAQFNLGLMYLNGLGVARCRDTAMHWLRQAAGQGHPDALQVMRRMAQRRGAFAGKRFAVAGN
jgi:TPR repeat protein